MEEEIEPYEISQPQWSPVVTGPLPELAVVGIVTALVDAESCLVVVGFAGRKPYSVPELIRLAYLNNGSNFTMRKRLRCIFHAAAGHTLAI